MKNVSNKCHITIIQFDFKLILDKVVIWWLFGNVPRMLQENVLLTWFECQRFYMTTKDDAIHIVDILVLIKSHLHISYGNNLSNLYIFADEMCKIRYICYHKFLVEIWHINNF